MTNVYSVAPFPTYRLIPSQFPPIGLFDTIATAADLLAVMDLVGWTNDRLVAGRIARLPQHEWVYGRPNASIVMAAFLHVSPTGMRFNSPELGAWYTVAEIETAAAEVGHHLRREAVARNIPEMRRIYRSYSTRLDGLYLDIRGQQAERPDLYATDRHDASQRLGEAIRASDGAGIVYDSLRRCCQRLLQGSWLAAGTGSLL
ncbi:hypothetical protein DC522_27110 [Microvirga sp. KLBC 81]|uniref:RES family NAD+ phosphorylase n=1 Tax=Microvirga sp. KLBC 81 TaxID=1862707 RepID=UPI000D507EB3|nr:RES family NAD+ phosphorylase [Microvirga sp. KLBC 81]PVE21347.1 hypothetical protein DC522_27110 [Microvirga sp. KLBC 81]